MVTVTVGVDADEIAEGDPGDQPDTAQVTLDVCRNDELIWFDPGELDELPQDLENPKPSADEQAKIDQIVTTFGESVDAAYDERHDAGIVNRFANHVVAHHSGFTSLLDRLPYRASSQDALAQDIKEHENDA